MIKPVKRIAVSPKDEHCLLTARSNPSQGEGQQPDHYRDRVVIKPWGYEFLVAENRHVAIWFLHIKKDHSTSMHCHPLKKTSLTVLSGKALCNTFQHRHFLSAGDSLIIDPAVFHSTRAVSLDGISLIEVETPPAKLDLCRLEDKYGRQARGYESQAETVTEDLDVFGYFCFDPFHTAHPPFFVEGRYALSLEFLAGDPDKSFPDPGSVYCVCQGRLLGRNRETLVGVGETERGSYLANIPDLSFEPDTVLLKMAVFT
ncbi:MAG: hypothetical protein HQM02_11460 [Magnetococcales bacterium]|nr:hypothetical protein [Magnetococcales bacterium]